MGADKFNNDIFIRDRRYRLADILTDYLSDEDCDARYAYEELLSEVDDLINYHQKHLNKAVQFKELLLGHRPVDL